MNADFTLPPKLPVMDREASFAALAALDEGGAPKWTADADGDRDLHARLLPSLADSESLSHRLSWLLIAAIVVALVAKLTFTFWAPAHGGVDQNGYLMGGRQFSHTLSTKFVPPSPYQYVGNMWVMMGDQDGSYFPKYPLGMPVLYAAVLWIGNIVHWLGGTNRGTTWAFLISPVSMVLATAGMFYLARALAGSFAATMAAILLATSQFTLELANNPNSHAACLAFVVWGMFFLLRWWQTNSLWRGLLAGFFLGFACTIRYTEGLLVLPMALAVACSLRWQTHSILRWVATALLITCAGALFHYKGWISFPIVLFALAIVSALRWRDWRGIVSGAAVYAGWLLPVGYLLLFNKIAMGSWTGYDTTNESDAFTWQKFADTWEQVIRMFNDRGMFLTLPLGLLGIALVFRRSWQYGLVLVLWLIPGVALYTSYYWSSPDRGGIGYARFFVTFLPPLIIGTAVLIRHGVIGSDDFGLPRRSIGGPIAVGIIVAAAGAMGIYRSLIGLENGQLIAREALPIQYRQEASLFAGGEEMLKHVPAGSLVFSDGPQMAEGAMNYWSFLSDWQLFQFSSFTSSFSRAFAMVQAKDPTNPSPRQSRRIEYDDMIRRGKSAEAMIQDQQKIVQEAFKNGKRVFVVGSKNSIDSNQPKFFPAALYAMEQISGWNEQSEPLFGEEPPKPDENQTGRGFMGGRGQVGPGGQRGNRGQGGPGGQRGAEGTPTSWRIVEVTLRTPATKPAAN